MHKQEPNKIKKLDELIIANKELAFQNEEKEKRVAELIIANSDLKKAEEKSNKARRLYSVISQINQLIARTSNEKTLFKKTCNIAIDLGKFRMAWIGIVDEKTKKIIPVAHAGEEHGYLSKIKKISVDKVKEGRGPTVKALREGKYSVCNDIENNPKMDPWKTEALNHGYYSSIALPIKKFGKVVGVFNLYAAEPNFFDDKEITLLDEITVDISFALENFGKEEQRKKVETALHESEDIFRRLFSESADSTLLLDDTGFIDCNQSAISILGYSSREEVLNKKPWDISPEKQPDGRLSTEKAKAMIAKALQQGYNRFEWVHTKSDGTEFPVEVMLTPITLRGKQSFYTIWRDISERKEAELERRKNESNFRHLMDAIPDALLGTNKEGKIVYANLQASILFGYSTDELLNNKIEMLLPERFHSRHESYREGYQASPVSREGGKIGMSLYGRRKDGSEFATEISLSSIETEEGLVVLSAIRDITEKKKAEQAIIHSEARFKKAQEVAHIGNWELDFTNGNTFMSDEACRIHGISLRQNEQSPEAWLSFIHPEDLDFVLKSMKEAQDHLSDFVLNYRIKRKDGTIRHIYSETKFQFESTDKPTGMYGIAHDITERIKAEEELKKYAEALKSSNTELEQFAYAASHDLQEPLRMVSSFLNLLEKRMEGQLDDTSRQYIDFAVDGAERMKKLILALLEYSRVGTNKEDFAPVDLNEVVQYVIKVLEENIKKNTALITFKFLPVITANKTLITHLFLNLVNNALKYHNGNQTEIEIGSTEDEDWYFIYVRDNGIGIDPKFFDKIFVIFQRLQTKNEYSGTGIGLAICKKIVEIHKGKIWVESETGKGSTFYFSIPKTTL